MDMGTQGSGRKRLPNRERLTAEDDALNQIAREVGGGRARAAGSGGRGRRRSGRASVDRSVRPQRRGQGRGPRGMSVLRPLGTGWRL